MKKVSFELPSLYGDHHVLEVRRILLEMPGVEEVYASSSFHTVEVGYNPEKLSEGDISARLEQAGYLGDFNFPAEVGQESYQRDAQGNFFRHTAVYETTRQVVSFSQNVNYSGRALWPCPGFGPVKMEE